jgi:hypothetical protein
MRRIDALRQRHAVAAIAVGVAVKLGDDHAGGRTVQLTSPRFTTVFPPAAT